ncbi:MAG: hypothetical protein RQ966_12895 [Acetobacteraceae bacterium]|nr:hypothetical protein [Acetobacteraceae bacterium]
MSSSYLPRREALRLASILGLLGSPLAGERDAAAASATRLLAWHRLTWRELLAPPSDPASRRASEPDVERAA